MRSSCVTEYERQPGCLSHVEGARVSHETECLISGTAGKFRRVDTAQNACGPVFALMIWNTQSPAKRAVLRGLVQRWVGVLSPLTSQQASEHVTVTRSS